ncbi:MAG: metallophosphoesterase [Bacteroidales bacterium]|nr:metallophosphoesterase [Bacteroidales bacterium]
MKQSAMIIFLVIVLSIYSLANTYIYLKTRYAFGDVFPKNLILNLAFWFVVLAYPLGRILERVYNSSFSIFMVKIGSFWMGAMLYLILLFLLVTIFKVLNHYIEFTPYLDFKLNPLYKKWVIISVYTVASLILLSGYINARFPRVSNFKLKFEKTFEKTNKTRIVAVSDIHLGTLISTNRLEHLVNLINKQNPDIVLFAGDVFDEDIAPVVNNGLGRYFEKIKSRLGVFAIPGNHEYFGGVEPKLAYLRSHGIIVLRDSTVLIDSSFYIVGRDDRQSNYTTGKQRKSISELIENVDKSKPIILLDHQPFKLNESAKNGIDLQISGHTHHGQLWPFNYITNAIYELSSGYKKIGNTHFIVSNGYGTWGPPIRLGNRPEILVIDFD